MPKVDKTDDLLNEARQREFSSRKDKTVNDLRFEKQVQFANDPSHFKAALCGRRAGKTRELVYEYKESLDKYPDENNVFIELTRPSAKNKLWRPFRKLNKQYNWGYRFTSHDGLRVENPVNGSCLYVVGADRWDEIDKIRGLENIRFAAIDECGQQKPLNLQYLTEEVLEPALMDVDGRLSLCGTPGLSPIGFWWEVTGQQPPKPGWDVHHWTVYDNPFLNGEKFIKELLIRRQWTKDNPIFQREYLGRWIRDVMRLVYAYDQSVNEISDIPDIGKGWTFVLAMDFGTVASTAWAILGFGPYGFKVFVLKSFKKAGLAPTEVADITRDLIQEWHPDIIVGDLGGLGKAYAEEMMRRHGIAIKAAQKSHKRATIDFVSDALRTGQLLSVKENRTLHQEWSTLIWDDEKKDIAAGQDDHESDAVMYGWRECPAYANAIAPPIEERDGLPEWVDRDGEMANMDEEEPYWFEDEW